MQMAGGELENESMYPTCIPTTIQAGGGNIMTWGDVFLELQEPYDSCGRMSEYLSLLNFCYKSCTSCHVNDAPYRGWILSAGQFFLSHTTGIVCRWLERREGNLTLISSPVQPPDLTPINICGNRLNGATGSWIQYECIENCNLLIVVANSS
ncbi:hypothetical protein TNCV_187391 [Trichonephila clavipes]|nr:hypothetical protein TNCV_187391 [Trichonephila clavipes]